MLYAHRLHETVAFADALDPRGEPARIAARLQPGVLAAHPGRALDRRPRRGRGLRPRGHRGDAGGGRARPRVPGGGAARSGQAGGGRGRAEAGRRVPRSRSSGRSSCRRCCSAGRAVSISRGALERGMRERPGRGQASRRSGACDTPGPFQWRPLAAEALVGAGRQRRRDRADRGRARELQALSGRRGRWGSRCGSPGRIDLDGRGDRAPRRGVHASWLGLRPASSTRGR